MAFHVINADQGLSCGYCDALGHVEANHQRPGQAWPLGHSNRIDILDIDMGLAEGLSDEGGDSFNVLPGSQFGEHAAVLRVEVNLAGDHVGFDDTTIADNSGCGFVAGCFYPKDTGWRM
jgi:hypothetical protein